MSRGPAAPPRAQRARDFLRAHEPHAYVGQLTLATLVQTRDRVADQNEAKVALARLVDRCARAVGKVAAREHECGDAILAQVVLERRSVERPPARLVHRHLARTKRLHATREQQLVVEAQIGRLSSAICVPDAPGFNTGMPSSRTATPTEIGIAAHRVDTRAPRARSVGRGGDTRAAARSSAATPPRSPRLERAAVQHIALGIDRDQHEPVRSPEPCTDHPARPATHSRPRALPAVEGRASLQRAQHDRRLGADGRPLLRG